MFCIGKIMIIIINNDLEVCYEQISNYIDCEINKKSNYNIDQIRKHIKKLTPVLIFVNTSKYLLTSMFCCLSEGLILNFL